MMKEKNNVPYACIAWAEQVHKRVLLKTVCTILSSTLANKNSKALVLEF